MGDENSLAGTTKSHKHSAPASDGGFLETTVTGITNLSEGSIVYGDASEIVTELVIGATEGDVLSISSGLPAWTDPSHVSLPSGLLIQYAGLYDSIPSGWLLCDGSEISRTTYADLFTAIGVQFGSLAGDTFTLPLFQNNFVRAPAVSTSCGATGGTDDITLSTAQMPSHTHVVSDGGHAHSTIKRLGGGGAAVITNSASAQGYDRTNPVGGTATTGISLDTAGSSSSFDNRPTYLEVLFIIKT